MNVNGGRLLSLVFAIVVHKSRAASERTGLN